MRTRKFDLKLSSFFMAVSCLMLGILFSTTGKAQTPADCNSGCTSGDVQIIGAYLSDASGNALTSYVCGSGVPVYLTLQLTTQTPRKGVSIYSDIQTVDAGGHATGTSVGTVAQCFHNSLNTTTNTVTFANQISWTCGQQIALVGTYTAWGTGNKDFCTGNGFQCGGTPSKCHSAQVGEIIIIQTPQTGSASATHCSDLAGGYHWTFDLTALQTNIISNASNYNFLFYNISSIPSSSADTAGNRITNPSAFAVNASSATLYAYVCDKAHPGACSWAPITLTVKLKPATPSPGNDGPICAGNTLHLSVGAVATASYSWTGPNSFSSASQSPSVASATTAAAGTYHLIITLDGCASNDGTTTAVVNAQPLTPTIRISQDVSLCSNNSSGSIEVCGPNASYTYSISVNGGAYGDAKSGASVSFTGLAAGSNPVVKVSNGSTGCVATQSCTNAVTTCPNPANATRTHAQPVTEESQTTVKAYPNPFSDRVKFLVNSSVAGRGSLDVYNMMGQKIRTVYQGFIQKGTQTFELSLPTQQISNLVYILRVGDKKMSGKILQINQ